MEADNGGSGFPPKRKKGAMRIVPPQNKESRCIAPYFIKISLKNQKRYIASPIRN